MSEQGGNWADGPDETERGADLGSRLGYLRAAAGWLKIAEQEFEQLKDGVLQEGGREYIPRGGGYALLTEGSARLVELNIAMATACGEHRGYELQRKTAAQIKADNAEYVKAMGWNVTDPESAVREQLKADDEEHQAVTLRPGVDPEPEAEGELWTDDGQRFVYAAHPLHGPGVYYPQRWLIVKHYAQHLRWQSAPEPKSSLETWEGLDGKIGWSDDAPLRRPTAEELAVFYGPEPDPQPAIEETHERTTTIPPIRLDEFTNQQGTSLADLADKELESLINSVTNECARRQRDNGTPWRSPGGAGQWNG